MSPQTPNIPLEEMTLRQLRRVASEYEVSRYSRMRKVELIAAIKQKQIAAGVRTAPTEIAVPMDGQTQVEAAKFSNPAQRQSNQGSDHMDADIAVATSAVSTATPDMAALATVDDGLGELPGGYGESRIVLLLEIHSGPMLTGIFPMSTSRNFAVKVGTA